jgi:hypothetical protein
VSIFKVFFYGCREEIYLHNIYRPGCYVLVMMIYTLGSLACLVFFFLMLLVLSMLVDYLMVVSHVCTLGVAAQIHNMEEPSVFGLLFFSCLHKSTRLCHRRKV